MHRKLSLIFFLSGISALIFETLWFRIAGLSLGNSVWSVSLVLAAFMAGIALGNAAVARLGARLSRPILVYAWLEIAIGLAGVAVVLGLPGTSALLGAALGHVTGAAWLLNLVRLSVAFIVLAIPAIAMGATLPVLTEALSRRDSNFGATLGRLYGWNTLGAMLGALVSELALIKWLGVAGSGLAAMLLNLSAAVLALRISRSAEAAADSLQEVQSSRAHVTLRTLRYLAVACFSGAIMLALEVVWFRFLLLSHHGTSLIFAIMLAVVLAGIAVGGLVAARLYRADDRAHAWLPHVTAFSGALVALTYGGFDLFTAHRITHATTITEYVGLSTFLMFPIALMSGIAFTMCGRAVKDELGPSARTAGIVTFANTLGAMSGSLIGAFVLLPVLGMELSFFALAAGYALTALVVPRTASGEQPYCRAAAHGSLAIVATCLAFFPFGLMEASFLRVPEAKLPDHTLVETREGLTETASYYSYDRYGEPIYYRLMTNGFSMSATSIYARRYMKLFVYLPLALKPDVRDALLISFGTGSTAKALTDTKSLQHIDVVDISRDILDMSSVVFSEAENPRNDARVRVHVEDGRFFLNATSKRYDLITSEPPPPMLAGVVNLYSQEYFELVRAHLNPGGFASYWLPVHQLAPLDALAITRAFCNAFEDCTLWAGSGLDWILMGTNDARPGVSVTDFSAQWAQPQVFDELKNLGIETPAQLGSLFMGDADQLAELTRSVPPVTDNYPLRISDSLAALHGRLPLYDALLDTQDRLRRFRESSFVNQFWPAELKAPSEPFFTYEHWISEYFMGTGYRDYSTREQWEAIDELLTKTDLETLPLWLLGSDGDTDSAVDALARRGKQALIVAFERALRDLVARDYPSAVENLDSYMKRASADVYVNVYLVYLYALASADMLDEARIHLARLDADPRQRATLEPFIDWYIERFDSSGPATARHTAPVAASR